VATRPIDLGTTDVANSFIAIQCDVNKSSFDSSGRGSGGAVFRRTLLFKRGGAGRNGLVGT